MLRLRAVLSIATFLLAAMAWPAAASAQTATVTATVLPDGGDPETMFTVEMGGQSVLLPAGGTATDTDAPADRYTMVLLPDPGFRLTEVACFDNSGGRVAATVTLENQGVIFAPGDGNFVNCLFKLEALTATVRTRVLTDADKVETEFVVEMEGNRAELAQGEVATDRRAPAALYRMALLPQPEFRLMDIVCRDVAGERLPANVAFDNQSIAFAPGIGGVVDCTFQLQARVATVTAMVLTDSAYVDTEFVVEMGEETARMVQGMTAIDRNAAGQLYRMSLQPVAGLQLTDIVCVKDNARVPAEITFENQSIAFAPGIGSVVDCTFRLMAQTATVTATVLVDIGYVEREFTVEMEGTPRNLLHGQTTVDRAARAQNYRMALVPARGFRLTDIICVDEDGERMPANIAFENQSIAFAPGAGRFVNCMFRVEAGPDAVAAAAAGSAAGAASTAAGAAGAASTATGDCCSCRVAGAVTLQAPPMLPCTFNVPAGHDARFGDDGALISAVVGAQCGAACSVSPTMSFTVASRPNSNAETMEEIWSMMMQVVGTGSCGGHALRFYETPGSEPQGQLGGVQFHVTAGGKLYSANATFSCQAPGEWQQLRDLFIGTLKSNPDSTFGRE